MNSIEMIYNGQQTVVSVNDTFNRLTISDLFREKSKLYAACKSFNGKTQTITDWSIETGINRLTLTNRIRKGWSVERALTEPVNKY